MIAAPRLPKLTLLVVLSALGFALTAASADAATARFKHVPKQLVPGKAQRLSVAVRSGTNCNLVVRDAHRVKRLHLRAVKARGGRAVFRFKLPEASVAGQGRVNAICKGAKRLSRKITVAATATRRAELIVDARGFSQRDKPFGGASVSYGLLLRNSSPDQDALDISLLVNFIDANDRVLQSHTQTVSVIRAGSTYALGGSQNLPDWTPVSRLEVVYQIGGRTAASARFPLVENIRIVASRDPGWVGSVDGEVINTDAMLALRTSRISTVLFDAAGNIVGGSTGFLTTQLLPGARVFFTANSGANSIPLQRAAMARVSVDPTYGPVE